MQPSIVPRLTPIAFLVLIAAGCVTLHDPAAARAARSTATDETPIEYTVSLPAPQTQMVEISMRVPAVTGPTLDLALPTWRPGRYVILDPAGTVRQVRAQDETGQPLAISKLDKSTWRVQAGGSSTVRVDYRIYANSIRDRTRHVDDTHAFLSGSSVFMYVPERRGEPVAVHIDAPEGWRVATGLDEDPAAPGTFLAASYDVLVDSPLEIGLHDELLFDVDGVPHEIIIWPPDAADYEADQLIEDFGKIVAEQAAIFGEMPYERYVFLMHVGAGAGGGTEHLNSTIMQTSRRSLEDEASYKRFLGLVSHEFFHTWNVKQLRPAGIHPYDYQRENYTKLLWVSEGTTSYYDDLTLVRSGLIKPKRYLQILSDSIDSLRNRPGAKVQSLEESSFDAWIKFNRFSPDDVNSEISFYHKGALVSLLLDMELRARTEGKITLDEVLRVMYEQFPLSGPGFTPEDLIRTTSELAGSEFDPFFAQFVRGTDALPLEAALEHVGLELKQKASRKTDQEEDGEDDDEAAEKDDEQAAAKTDQEAPEDDGEMPMKAYLGLSLSGGSGGASVLAVRADGPAYEAGIEPGDVVLALNGRRLAASALDDRLEKLEPGQVVEIVLFRRDRLRTFQVTLTAKPDAKWTVSRVKEPTDAQKAAYESWIGQPWPAAKDD